MRRVAIAIATGLGVGFAPVAPATVASFVVALLLVPLVGHVSTLAWGLAILALLPIAVWSSGEAEKTLGTDAKPIVIDEVVGMLITLAWIPVTPTGALVGFLIFRLFDVIKPWPSRRFESLHGGLGIMSDDAMAAVYGNLLLRGLVALAPAGWLV